MPDRQNKSAIDKSEQKVLNWSFDEALKVLAFLPLGYDGKSLQKATAGNTALKVTKSGDHTYVGSAAPGTLESEAKWQAMDVYNSSGNITVKWADGDSNFDNIATDLTSLSYS